jgi:tetratricopeptide (TPR) repeat protein
MKFRTVSATSALAILLTAPQANAAVSVLGNTVASGCYQAAEFGINPKDGIETCSYAIQNEALSIRDRAATYINRGILRSRATDPTGALADYNAGLALDGTLAEGYVDRGATYIVLQKYDTALQDINKGIDLGAHKPQIAYYDRAIVNEALGNIRGAYEDYKKAVEIAPDFGLATEQLTRFKVIRRHSDGT